MGGRIRTAVLAVAIAGVGLAFLPASAPATAAASSGPPTYWTPARLAAATPRDLVVDGRGKGYRRRADGSLEPHGHADGQLYATSSAKAKPVPTAKPGGGDTQGPSVSSRVPAAGATVGASPTFSATVTDPSGVRSVTVVIVHPDGVTTSSFAAAASGSTWSATISGFTDGSWGWRIVARDRVGGTGNATTTGTTGFTVSTGTGGGGGTGDVTNAQWTAGGTVQNAAGRIYFEMPENRQATRWAGYVCSGTVARDATTGRSIILTAAHCVYDDVNKAFARNVLFIPNQAGTSGDGTDTNCANDPLGCWVPSFGVVDTDWTTRTFPNNTAWDYAFYVVSDTGARRGTAPDASLDGTAGDQAVQLSLPATGTTAHALGYSYSEDPHFMYCGENLALESGGDWWLGHCGLSGGASGGPWLQPATGGNGPIISVNSWGYTNQPGMAGPRLDTSSAGCVFGSAKSQTFGTVSNRGIKVC